MPTSNPLRGFKSQRYLLAAFDVQHPELSAAGQRLGSTYVSEAWRERHLDIYTDDGKGNGDHLASIPLPQDKEPGDIRSFDDVIAALRGGELLAKLAELSAEGGVMDRALWQLERMAREQQELRAVANHLRDEYTKTQALVARWKAVQE